MEKRIFSMLSPVAMGIGIILLMLSSISILSYVGVDTPAFSRWAQFDRTSAIGPMDYTLTADFDNAGFEYELTAEPGDSGGIISGFGQNVSIGPVRKTYPEVRGEFLENMGILYNSYKDKTYVYKILMDNIPDDAGVEWDPMVKPFAYLNVSLHSDLIPWWTESGKMTMTLTVTYIGNDLDGLIDPSLQDNFEIILRRYQVKSKIYDDEAGDFKDRANDIILDESTKEVFLRSIGDSVDFEIEAEYPEGTSVAGLYADISAGLTDYWGRDEYSTLTGNANTINIYPMETSTLVKGMGIPISLPLILLSVLIGLVSAIVNMVRHIKGRSPMMSLIIPGMIIALVAPLWFYIGIDAAVDLLSQKLAGAEEGLSMGPGFFICLAGAFFYLISMTLAVTHKFTNGGDGAPKETDVPSINDKLNDHINAEEESSPAPPIFKQVDPARKGPGRTGQPPNR